MQKYYTAVGRFERKGRMGDMTCPMVVINKREYALDIQEMILWATLNWQIMDEKALEDACPAKLKASGITPQRSIHDCMRRLLQRRLVVEGCGETGEDALYARTQYYQVVAFGAIASQFAKKLLHRGALVSVEGVLELEDYLKRDGWTRDKRLKVIAFRWRYLQPGEVEAPVSEQIPEIDGEREPLPG